MCKLYYSSIHTYKFEIAQNIIQPTFRTNSWNLFFSRNQNSS